MLTITSFKDRFEVIQAHDDIFSILYDFHVVKTWTLVKLKSLSDPNFVLKDEIEIDIDGTELEEELIDTTLLLTPGIIPLEVSNYIYNDYYIIFPYTDISQRNTHPVTVAGGKRSFSKIKQINNYFKSTVTQERLVDVSLLPI